MSCPLRRQIPSFPWVFLWLLVCMILQPACATAPDSITGVDATTASVPPSRSTLPLSSFDAAGPSDMVLIYQGGTDRLAWTPEQLAPYVSAHASDGGERWLFDGFLFIEYRDNRGHAYAHGYSLEPARKEDWLWLIERNFAPHGGVPALDQALDSTIRRLGTPERPRQVVLTLPEPIPESTHWGSLEGRPLDFRNPKDRVAACRWHIETALAKWDSLHPKHLEMAGFYWVAEDDKQDATILPLVAEIIHAHGLRFFWIPYWRAGGAQDWSRLGFDAAYQQPNHFFHPEVKDERLEDACAFARSHHMGLEFECDSRACKSPELFRPRLYSYLRAFEMSGVRDEAAIAYYEGGGALLEMFKSPDAKCRADYQAIADWVMARHSRVMPVK
ncbi:MAG TPA: DUF4855 domain-containing protein [Candidatus Polarisedimenticolia bacterium]|nr:DUF4855 domain-containing protein [Candidatus Polarisedimenticolia bacterium]